MFIIDRLRPMVWSSWLVQRAELRSVVLKIGLLFTRHPLNLVLIVSFWGKVIDSLIKNNRKIKKLEKSVKSEFYDRANPIEKLNRLNSFRPKDCPQISNMIWDSMTCVTILPFIWLIILYKSHTFNFFWWVLREAKIDF